jgi:hypothetical protein
LRSSIHKLIENRIQPLTAQELQTSVSAFLDLCPDGFALHQKSKRFAILEFTRAMGCTLLFTLIGKPEKNFMPNVKVCPWLAILAML